MCRKATGAAPDAALQSFLGCLRYFLTPALWRQVHQTPGAPSRKIRWSLQPLVLALLTMTWCQGDSQEERFETARAFCVAARHKSKQPGRTVQGWQKALARLPLRVLRLLAAGVRQRITTCLASRLTVHGWIPLGCDGTRLECPREQELEQRLGQAGKDKSAPMVSVSAIVHLATGLLWSWQIGKGDASEHTQMRRLLPTLPDQTLLVADAGYFGYDLFQDVINQGVSFLFRVSSKAYLYSDANRRLKRWREGEVWFWPDKVQKRKLPPQRLRLLRVSNGKTDVWLLTNVLDRQRLSRSTAGQFYRWRWQNEGFFRTYKRTLDKVKLTSRTIALVHREVEGSLLAVQILLAHGAMAMNQRRCVATAQASPRQVLLVLRSEIQREITVHLGRYQCANYFARLQKAHLKQRRRRSGKTRRPWPNRRDHRPPGPPQIRPITPQLKAVIQRISIAA